MSNIVSKQVLEQAGIKLPMNVENMLLCGGLEIRKLLTMIADTINRVVCTSDENAKRLQEWTGSVSGWAEEFEKQIRNAVQNGVMNNLTIADGAVTISKLSQDVKDKIQQAAESMPFLDVEATADSVTIVYDDTKDVVLPLVMATATMAGMMSAADKVKLDGLKNYTLPASNANTLGGVRTSQTIRATNGQLFTSLEMLGLTFDTANNRIKFVDENGNVSYFTLTPAEVNPDDDSTEEEKVKVYWGSSNDGYDIQPSNPVFANYGQSYSITCDEKYFALFVPSSASLGSLQFGPLMVDLIGIGKVQIGDAVEINGAAYTPYKYYSPRTSSDNKDVYWFSVNKQ